MNQPIPTGPDLFGFGEAAYGKAKAAGQQEGQPTYGSAEEVYQFRAAQHYDMQALTAAIVMLTETVDPTGTGHADLDAWREKIGLSWLKKCKSKEWRRPQCAERHTEDCDYAEPPPEPKHVLLDIGTRVLVAPLHDPNCTCASTQPYVGKVAGYDMGRSKYQINEERYGTPGEYYNFVKWEFVSNRVAVHPDGPEYPLPPIPDGSFAVNSTWRMRKPNTGGAGEIVTVVRRTRGDKDELLIEFDRGEDMPEDYRRDTWPSGKFTEWYERYEAPTGPRMYVQDRRGRQGYVLEVRHRDPANVLHALVQWFSPGTRAVWRAMDSVFVIAPEDVERCPNGQTRDECGSGENQCELCLAAEDAEAEEIEESMGLR